MLFYAMLYYVCMHAQTTTHKVEYAIHSQIRRTEENNLHHLGRRGRGWKKRKKMERMKKKKTTKTE